MTAFGRIVHPTDFSAESAPALAVALRLALAAKGELQLLHAHESGEGMARFPQVRPLLQEWGVLAPGAEPKDVADLGLKVTKTELEVDDIGGAVGAYLVDHPGDLIVLATQGRAGLARLARPSRAEPIARRARLPALFLPAEGSNRLADHALGGASLTNVLVCADSEPDPNRALEAAHALAQLLDAAPLFSVLHVGAAFSPRVSVPAGVASTQILGQGPVVEAILNAARDTDADLIVMTTRGHDGFLDALRGSTTEQVLRRAPCALLAVPV